MPSIHDFQIQTKGVLEAASVDVIFVTGDDLTGLGKAKGSYVLCLTTEEDIQVKLPKGRYHDLPAGSYLYAGSAYGGGGIAARLRRHFKKEKSVRWHIDQLSIRAAEIGAFASVDEKECRLVECLQNSGLFSHIIPGFGSSDCRRCESHLLAFRPTL